MAASSRFSGLGVRCGPILSGASIWRRRKRLHDGNLVLRSSPAMLEKENCFCYPGGRGADAVEESFCPRAIGQAME